MYACVAEIIIRMALGAHQTPMARVQNVISLRHPCHVAATITFPGFLVLRHVVVWIFFQVILKREGIFCGCCEKYIFSKKNINFLFLTHRKFYTFEKIF